MFGVVWNRKPRSGKLGLDEELLWRPNGWRVYEVAGAHEWELVVKWLGTLSLAQLSPSWFSFIPQKHEAYKLKVKFNKIQQELDNNL